MNSKPARRHQIFEGALVGLLALAVACSSEPDPVIDTGVADPDTGMQMPDTGVIFDSGVEDTGNPDPDSGVLLPCQPALTSTPTDAKVLPLDLLTIVAGGGTGEYRFEFVQNESGAIVDSLTGAYLAGEEEGANDIVEITDLGCTGSARVDVEIVQSLVLIPQDVQAPPGTGWTFEVRGGSGVFEFTLLRDDSGATLNDATYTAGQTAGLDLVQVTDLETGRQAEARIEIAAGAVLSPNPPIIFIGLNQTHQLEMNGGSGFIEFVDPAPHLQLDDRTLTAIGEGEGTLQIRDRFTAQTAQITIDVVVSQAFTPVVAGDGVFWSSVVTGDFNGDGFDDAAFGHGEADVEGYNRGAVFIYQGTATGLDTSPAKTLVGAEREARFGQALSAADFDGDGLMDLAVGAPYSDAGQRDIGRVAVFYGDATAMLEDEPRAELTGRFSFDLFGWSVTTCDFNGDGRIDIAGGAYNTENRNISPAFSNQGGVFVFLQEAGGFRDASDTVVYGEEPDGSGGFVGDSNQHLGSSIGSGDFDGDGACDLVAGAYTYVAPGVGGQDGLVYLYRGVLADATSNGGIETAPAAGWANLNPADPTGQFGYSISTGNIDGDAFADILVGHRLFDNGAGDQWGAAHVFRGGELTAGPITALAPTTTADWTIVGDNSYDQFGFNVHVDDFDGDGVDDVWVSGQADEIVGGPGTAGRVAVYRGAAGGLPEMTPTAEFTSEAAGDRLGVGIAGLTDRGADGRKELVSLAYWADRDGVDFGVPYYISSDAGPTALEWHAEPSGMRFGWSGDAVGDLNGDGFEDLVVGAPWAGTSGIGLRTGAAYVYFGNATGYSRQPDVELTNVRRVSGSDYFGMAISKLGDFNGDGREDLAVASWFEDLIVNQYPAADYIVDADCVNRNNTGAVHIFLGGRGVFSRIPAFIYYPPVANPGIREVEGNIDYNGDDLMDLVVGGLDWDKAGAGNSGGLAFASGRAAPTDGRTRIICGSDFTMRGVASNDQLGRAVAAFGDLDGDGCDEVAAGAPYEDLGTTNQGTVRVIFGFGAACGSPTPMMTTLMSQFVAAEAGTSLHSGGVDLNNDNIPELAVGLPGFRINNQGVGAAVVLFGDYVAGLPREVAQGDTAPTILNPLIDTRPGRPIGVAVGATVGERFGQSMALFSSGPLAAMLATSPNGDPTGTTRSGGARVYLWNGTAFVPTPAAVFGGETVRTNSQTGYWANAGTLNGAPVAIVGGYYGLGNGIDTGSLYVLKF